MPLCAALALLAALCSLQVGCCSACQEVNQTDVSEGQCPITLTSTPLIHRERGYAEIITLQVVWMKKKNGQSLQIEIHGQHKEVFSPITKCKTKSESDLNIRCCKNLKKTSLWMLESDFKAEARKNVTVSYSSKSTNCSVYYLVPDPRPDFSLSVNKSSKTISVDVDSGDPVNVRWCYERNPWHCSGPHPKTTRRSAVLSIPHLLPCVCVEVYYTYADASRHKKCPFGNESVIDIGDILQTSVVEVFQSHLLWSSECPASTRNISAALCWKMHDNACIPLPNSTLEKVDEQTLKFKISTVDKHPLTCVQFSIQDSHNISCFFEADKSSWETHITPGRQSMSAHITSAVPAKFSAQLCVLTESGCVPRGQIHTGTMRINVPIRDITERPCVQVWQSAPALTGRRIVCPDYTHNRWDVCAVGALIFLVICTALGFFIHRATKSGMAGWLTIQRPLLLVCSSDKSTHVSAACALASMLQEELDASVHTALWAQSSQSQAGKGASVADLGPLPWLYGQWEAIHEAQGKILFVWSPEAKRVYKKWRLERVQVDDSWRADKMRASAQDYLKPTAWRLKNKKEKCLEKKGVEGFEDEDTQKEPSTVLETVFVAALACLEGALQEGKGKHVAIVYFQGLCHSRDIPQALRGIPRYCLPQEFSGLIQELAEVRKGTKSGEFRWHCWPRLLSKVLSVWLARQLAQRLQTVLPRTRPQSVSSSLTTASDQADSRGKPRPADTPGSSSEEQQLLHGSPCGTGAR
ncbi:interleukin-17 receptor C [Fundulus diaphanus]